MSKVPFSPQKILLRVALVLAAIGASYGLAYLAKYNSPNRDDVKLMLVKAEVGKLPIHPSLQKVGDNFTSQDRSAAAYFYFQTEENRATIESYYATVLPELGWTFDGSKSPAYFQKDDLRLYIEHRPDQSGWNCAFSLLWTNPANYSNH